MAEMQTMLAECLGMDRGISSDRKHLNSIQYKAMKEAERVMEQENRANRAKQITAQLPELEDNYREALENYETARENLAQL